MNDRRRPTAPRDRQLIAHVRFDDFAEGWIAYGSIRACPDDASAEFKRGYSTRRWETINELCSREAA